MSISYKDAGVDKEAGYQTVDLIRQATERTHNASVLKGLGSFGAMYQLGQYRDPVLVSGTDGVGTKLALAFRHQIYDTVGIDCVAMCVNDILCHGARPLFFLDYLACGKLDPSVAAQLVAGVARGCEIAGAALIGGETAEMPGMYQPGDYDIAGFVVGVVERDQLINGDQIQPGDVLIGCASNGVHSNGFSLIRKLFPNTDVQFQNESLGAHLLRPTRIYVPAMQSLMAELTVKGMAHITGGGVIENLPRALPDHCKAVFDRRSVPRQAIFEHIEQAGVDGNEMWGTFNMGVGFVAIVAAEDAEAALRTLSVSGETAFVVGTVAARVADEPVIELM